MHLSVWVVAWVASVYLVQGQFDQCCNITKCTNFDQGLIGCGGKNICDAVTLAPNCTRCGCRWLDCTPPDRIKMITVDIFEATGTLPGPFRIELPNNKAMVIGTTGSSAIDALSTSSAIVHGRGSAMTNSQRSVMAGGNNGSMANSTQGFMGGGKNIRLESTTITNVIVR